MKKALYLLGILTFFTSLICLANPELRDYSDIEMSIGTFIAVNNIQEISTDYFDEGDKVKFIVSNDNYLEDTNIIPKDSVFLGFVEKLNEPIIGTHGAIKIRLNKLVLTDGVELPVHAYIYSGNNNVIGGGLSAPAKWDKMPHYQYGFFHGTNQWVPGEKRSMGEHTVISAGAELLVVLTRPLYVTHVVIN